MNRHSRHSIEHVVWGGVVPAHKRHAAGWHVGTGQGRACLIEVGFSGSAEGVRGRTEKTGVVGVGLRSKKSVGGCSFIGDGNDTTKRTKRLRILL